MIEWFTQTTSEALGLLCVLGVITGIIRWKQAQRRDILLSFIVILAATAARELVVYNYGLTTWPSLAVLLSGLARLGQLVGAIMFVHSTVKGRCPEWCVWAMMALVFLVSFIL